MKTYPHILAAMALAAFCSCAAGQTVSQTGDSVGFTFTDMVTRVPVSPPVKLATGNAVSSNLLCHSDPTELSAPGIEPGTLSSYAGHLNTALFLKVNGKSADDLVALLEKVNKASGRDAKVQELFGIPAEQLHDVGGKDFHAPIIPLTAQQQLLIQMGQPVTITAGTPAFVMRATCYTTQQIDQAIDEGGRVVKAIIRALQAPNSSPQPKSPG